MHRCRFVVLLLVPAFIWSAESAPTATPTSDVPTPPVSEANLEATTNQREGTRPGEKQSELAEWTSAQIRLASRSGDLLGTAIFELIEDLDLYQIDIGAGTVKYGVGRKVYDNHDIVGSYTVVDRFRVKLDYPLYTASEAINNVFTANFGVGTNHRLDFLHIRQVRPSHFEQLESLDTSKGVFTPGWSQTGDTTESEIKATWNRMLPTIVAEAQPTNQDAFDGLGRARWGSLWNLLVIPMRVPFKPDWIERIPVGDIISWQGTGSIEVGPSLGIDFDIPGALLFYDASFAYRLFVSGNFRISVLREDNDHVRVKVSRNASFGDVWSFGGGTDGIISDVEVGSWNPFDRLTRVSPFAWSKRRSMGTGFDVVYRYDLRDSAARQAYRSAIFGKLTESDRLSGGDGWRLQDPKSAVRRVGTQDSNSRDSALSTGTRIGSLYQHRHAASITHSDLVVDIGSGPKRALRSRGQSTQRWRWFWGSQERIQTTVTVWVDRDRLDAGEKDALTLTISHEILDTSTSGPELNEYIDLVESATGRSGFFPRPPMMLPDIPQVVRNGQDDFDRRRFHDVPVHHPVRYGRSSFYAEITYSQDQIERFLNVPEPERWADLEAAFRVPPGSWSTPSSRGVYTAEHAIETLLNLPLYPFNVHLRKGSMLMSARAAARLWRYADRTENLERRVEFLVEMFASRRYSFELTRLLRLRLGGEAVSYVLKGSSYGFGTLRDEGQGQAPLRPLPEQMSDIIEFDAIRAHRNTNAQAHIISLQAEPIDHNRLRLKLNIPEGINPQALYIRIVEKRPWSLSRSLAAVVVAQLDRPLMPGHNEVVIDRRGGPLSDLLSRTEPGIDYTVVLAISADGLQWGPINEDEFIMPEPPPGAQDVMRPLLLDR